MHKGTVVNLGQFNNLFAFLKNNWCLISYGISNCTSNKSAIDYKRSSLRNNCKTASFFYKK